MKKAAIGLIIFSFFLVSSAGAVAVLNGGGILYGGTAGFNLDAPKGWVFDNESGKPDGLYCVMYPEGGSWAKSPIVIYGNIGEAGEKTLEQYIVADMDDMKQKVKNLKYTMSKRQVANKKFPFIAVDSYGINDAYERVLYVYAGKSVCMVVMSTKDRALFMKYRNAVYEVIKNIFYMEVHDTTGGKGQ
jgi:hypothetical protein